MHHDNPLIAGRYRYMIQPPRTRHGWVGWAIGAVAALTGLAAEPGGRPGAGWLAAHEADLQAALGVPRGLVVVLGDRSGQLALDLVRRTEVLVYSQLPGQPAVDAVQRAADQAGVYGTRVFVARGALARLHLADNLADAVVAVGRAAEAPEAEVLRVLRPHGTAWLGNRRLTKPALAGADDWSHPYHGPDNNPLSEDRAIRGPYLTQFLADPRYGPLPQVAAAAGGRIFKVFGHIAFKEREEPWLDTLAAFNGYNGTLLWQRPTAPALMVHRNTLIATPDRLYFGDDRSCKVYAAGTGELIEEIAPPAEQVGGTFWKWMALEDGVLYALIGEQEQRDPIIRLRSDRHGWPWNPLSPGFNQPEHTWGFGRTLVAIDLATRKIRWQHAEVEPVDSRALCMAGGRLFLLRFGAYLTCIEAKTGQVLWRKTKEGAPELFAALGPYLDRQDWRTNWRTTAYAKCTEQALYFAGPSVSKLLAVSAQDGRVLWEHPYSNYQLVIHGDGVYGISGQIDQDVSRKFDPLTGKILAEIKLGRRACSRPTGCDDAIFFRADEGSVRLDVAKDRPGLVSPMRAQCHDGVTIANGLLYWWPSVCDCNLTLYGITSLGSAGEFQFGQAALEAERLETARAAAPVVAEPVTAADWPTFRADNLATVTSAATVPKAARARWTFNWGSRTTPTAPTVAGQRVYVAGLDGVVRSLDAQTGETAWTAYTGGAVRYPPTIWNGRAYVGSGDGYVYCLAAQSGEVLWRFRAAPIDRRIPVYGRLQSTWPAASGVLVEQGVAYVAAGIVNYDGTHLYALDAATGQLKWQNNSSGHLDPEARTGVSVQGHLLWREGKLFLAGGNAVSPAVYDAITGRCLNDAEPLRRTAGNNVPAATSPRGAELFSLGNQVLVSGKPFYAHPDYPVYDASVFNRALVVSTEDRDICWVNNAKVAAYPRLSERRQEQLVALWRKGEIAGMRPQWQKACQDSLALALCRNAVIVATRRELLALSIENGQPLWTQPLPAAPVAWGLAVDREGRVLVTLEGGQVLCFGESGTLAAN